MTSLQFHPVTKRPTLLAIWTILAMSVPALVSAQEIMLKWGFVEGNEQVLQLTNRMEISMPIGFASQVMDQSIRMRQTVQSVESNGDATVTVTTEHIRMEGVGPGGDQLYDSDSGDTPTDPAILGAAAMVGQDYSMVVGADGTVKSIQGIEELIESMRSSVPPDVAPMLGEMFNAQTLTEIAQQGVQILPTDPISPGGSWQISFTMPNPLLGEVINTLTFILDGIEERDGRTVALLSSTGEIVADTPEDLAGLPMEMDVDAEMTGFLIFDVDRGLVLSSSTTTEMTMTMSGPDGSSMTMPMTTTSSLELLEYIPRS
ncbi:MAG: hypothetical protein CME17_00350 [Gemmatimonadetes bacterium]|nr:hypothetical protein [Gemmatimonadota bacterium]